MEQELRSFLTHRRSEELKAFVGLLDKNPELLNMKELHFLKDFIEKLGGTIPKSNPKPTNTSSSPKEDEEEARKRKQAEEEAAAAAAAAAKAAAEEEEARKKQKEEEEELRKMKEEEEKEREEPDPELMESDSLECADIPMGDEGKECGEEDRDAANSIKGRAMAAQGAGDTAEALRLFSEAIQRCPRMAILYASRASLLLALKRPNAAIRDCDVAVRLNPDSAKAYKVRGKAYRYLGMYEKAKKDLQYGNKLDFDDSTFAVQKFVEGRLKAKEDLAMKQAARERQREEERREKEREEIRRRREEAARKYAEEQKRRDDEEEEAHCGCGGGCDGCPGGNCGGCGGCGGGAGMGGLPAFLNDPEIIAALQDPVVGQKLMEALQNPAKLGEAMKDPKLAKIIQKIAANAQGGARTGCGAGMGGMPGGFGGMGGMPGGMGGMGGMPGFM